MPIAWFPRRLRATDASARVSAGAKSVPSAASAAAGAMIAVKVLPTSRLRAVAVVVRVPVRVRMAYATIGVPHARQPRGRPPRAVAVVTFRARSATTLSAPQQLARQRLPHRKRTARPVVPAVAATLLFPSLDSRLASVRRASRRFPPWPIRWLRVRSKSRVAVPVMAGGRVRRSRLRAPRLPMIRLRAVAAVVPASRAEVRMVPLEAPITLRLPSR